MVKDSYKPSKNCIAKNPADFDVAKGRFPYCIVWTPLPLITWFLPFIGHMGIARSDGVIRDFAGPYYVSNDAFAFGAPTKYVRLDPAKAKKAPLGSDPADPDSVFDTAIEGSACEYNKMMYSFCCNNCHSYAARALNTMAYDGFTHWNMAAMCVYAMVYSHYVSWGRMIATWAPFTLVALTYYFFFASPATPIPDS